MIHQLKIERVWLDRVRAYEKTAEVRYGGDRDFQVGDEIEFWSAEGGGYTGLRRRITHVLRDVAGLASGYVVLSLADPRIAEFRERAERAERSNAPLRGTITRLTRELKEARDAER